MSTTPPIVAAHAGPGVPGGRFALADIVKYGAHAVELLAVKPSEEGSR